MPILPTQNKPQAKAGSGFTNLQRYLQANKANLLGQTIAGRVQEAGEAARGAISQAGQKFGQQAEVEKERLGKVGAEAQSILGAPTEATEEQVGKFQRVLGAESLGPTGVQDAEQLKSQAQQTQALGRAGGTEQGRFGLLQRYVGGGGRGQYGLGQQRLDQMLLGQTGQQQLRSARAGTAGLTQQAAQQIGAAQAQGKELKGQARLLAESTLGKLGEQATGYDVAMGEKLAQQRAAAENVIKQITGQEAPAGADLNAAVEIDPEALRQIQEASGGALKEGTQLYTADIAPYLKVGSLGQEKTAAQSAADIQRAQALAKLGGQYFEPTEQYKALQPYLQQKEADRFLKQQFDVTSAADLAKAIQASKGQYESEIAGQRGQMENIMRKLSEAQPYQFSQTGGDIGVLLQGLTRAYQQQAKERFQALSKKDRFSLTPGEKQEYDQLKNVFSGLSAGALAPKAAEAQQKLYDYMRKISERAAPTTTRFGGGSEYLKGLINESDLASLIQEGSKIGYLPFTGSGDTRSVADFARTVQSGLEAVKANEAKQKEIAKQFRTLRTLKAKPSEEKKA